VAIPPVQPLDHDAGPGAGFHRLRVGRVVRETAEATTFVLDIPDDLRPAFSYRAGQYCTFRVRVGDRVLERCYSMSSTPGVDAELQVTVKRVPGGPVSNWMNESLAPGDVVEVSRPVGRFALREGNGDVVAFTAGSGITPVFSLVKAALATTGCQVRLFYANRDTASIIFADVLAQLADRHPDRLVIEHHLDAERGLVTPEALRPHVEASPGAHFYVCGPAPFMAIVDSTLRAGGVDPARVVIERFEDLPAGAPAVVGGAGTETSEGSQVTVELGGRTATTDHRAGTTILQTARQVGLAPPFSCEAGNCATCMARVVEGHAAMHANNALTDDEVAEGWVLTCQAVPTTPTVHVVYGYD
jgi:3-ketosteroid 9alpha-monooxygenase subunit B